jgi:hypothetical protein
LCAGSGTSSNNITNSNPLFVNAAGGDFHLQSNSPAINAGLIEAILATDCEGTTRPQGGGYDIGGLRVSLSAGGRFLWRPLLALMD